MVSRGISGPITINVYSGTYLYTNVIPAIPGSASDRPVIIQVVPGQTVNITGTKWGFLLDGAQYVTIKGFNIFNTQWEGIRFRNGASNNIIDGNYLYYNSP